MNVVRRFLRTKEPLNERTGIFKGKSVNKIIAALTAGIVGVILAGTMPEQIEKIAETRQEQTVITAWWGTLYPKFCFSQFPEDHKYRKEDVKISFWLAQVLDW